MLKLLPRIIKIPRRAINLWLPEPEERTKKTIPIKINRYPLGYQSVTDYDPLAVRRAYAEHQEKLRVAGQLVLKKKRQIKYKKKAVSRITKQLLILLCVLSIKRNNYHNRIMSFRQDIFAKSSFILFKTFSAILTSSLLKVSFLNVKTIVKNSFF